MTSEMALAAGDAPGCLSRARGWEIPGVIKFLPVPASELAPGARAFGGPSADRGARCVPQVHPGGRYVCTRKGVGLSAAPQAVSWPCGSPLQEIPADVYFKPPLLCALGSFPLQRAPSSKWEPFGLDVVELPHSSFLVLEPMRKLPAAGSALWHSVPLEWPLRTPLGGRSGWECYLHITEEMGDLERLSDLPASRVE